MKPTFLLVGLLGLAACQSTPTIDVATVEPTQPTQTTPEPAQPAPAAAQPDNPEYIELSMLTINGKPHEQLSTKMLISQLGRPDSIARGAVECGGELEPVDNANGDFWYYGKTFYEVAGSQAVLASFNVTTGQFQGKLGKLLLNQHTTLEDVRRFYPISAKQAEEPASSRPGEAMYLPFFYKGVPTDASLNLLFKNGRLQEVEFFSPC
ncbi:hypothetical protein [Hymenobacter yonginensis]|uniref:Lipoprotein SmpA/OmlA domain-containing protein n=1 Tax=Hymenobacter yonginensis TaxID=748197 RepID=A0ABY7PRE4_9BACT|nr:hypothetical protein [Hymenobacter yonginensis]WBO85440.1 hypothetical protein O9Z63_04160 [Hymenobacter yonginensis]